MAARRPSKVNCPSWPCHAMNVAGRPASYRLPQTDTQEEGMRAAHSRFINRERGPIREFPFLSDISFVDAGLMVPNKPSVSLFGPAVK